MQPRKTAEIWVRTKRAQRIIRILNFHLLTIVSLNYGRESLLEVLMQNIALLGFVNKLLKAKYFAVLPQVNFPANNFNFHWRWRLIGSKQVYLPKSYLLKRYAPLELIWTIMSIWLALVGCCWLLCAFGMLKIGLWHCRDLTMSCLLAEQRIKKDSVSHSC